MPVTTARQRVLAYLEKYQTATAEEIARGLGMTAANARHHLNLLQRDGRVQVIGQKNAERRGRPQQIYALASSRLGDNLPALTLALLRLLETHAPGLEDRLAALTTALLGSPDLPAAFTPRLNAAIEWLDAHHYHARWEAHAEGPHIIFAHCPYLAVLEDAPYLCQMDAHLLATLLGRPVTQIARREQSRRGLPLCIFLAARSGHLP
jgi:predicted ArsR family transcriptional regulator